MRYAFVCLLLFLCPAFAVQAQNNFGQASMDSLQLVLSHQKTTKDSLLILQKLVDLTPIRTNETVSYPDHISQFLELNKKAGLIDPRPYVFIQQGNNYWKSKQYHKALSAFQQAIADFDKQHKNIYPLLTNMRFLYNLLNDQDNRLKYYTQKLEYYQVNGPYQNIAACYHSIGGYYNYKGAYNQAIKYYLMAAELYRRFAPNLYLNDISVVGSVYNEWGNNKRAAYYLNQAIAIDEKLHDRIGLAYEYAASSLIAIDEHRYDDALNQINKSIAAIGKRVAQRLAYTLVIKAGIYLKMQKPELALPILKSVKGMADSIELHTVGANGYMETDYDFYQYYQAIGNIPKAETSLLQAKKAAFDENGFPLQLKYLRELGYFYKRQNEPGVAVKYFDQYFKLVDDQERGLSEFKVAQYETDAKDRAQTEHINQLKQEKALQDYQLSRRNALLWGSAVVLMLITGLLAFIYRQLHTNKKTLSALRKTQRQLIQSEKMASLGELTAGIAHEIQNPLNFVNNFSDLNREMMDELKQSLKNGDINEALSIVNDIQQNEEKINHHGKRADFIVKGMLEHSRTGTGEKKLTNINILADEFLKLSYHGLRAKDKSFNAEMITNFDEKLPKINVAQQDIGRVLLNLFNNAFYAVNLKQKTAGDNYNPTVTVITFAPPLGAWGVTVKDNGNGIPDAIKDKIMQPFFTTKPTGEGTGLGLSLSYDIIVKGHGGSIIVDTKEGIGSEFTIILPNT